MNPIESGDLTVGRLQVRDALKPWLGSISSLQSADSVEETESSFPSLCLQYRLFPMSHKHIVLRGAVIEPTQPVFVSEKQFT